MSNQIIIFDTTLRDGEQAPGASMTIPEKVEIAQLLEKLGVDVIEAGFPVSSPIQFEGVQRVIDATTKPVICALARAKEIDINRAGEALKNGKRTRIHTFIGTSDIHIDGKFGANSYGATLTEKRKTVLKMAVDAVKLAKTFTHDIEFSAEDAGRTDLGYLIEVVQAVIEAGATTINIPDTTGFCLPEEYATVFRKLTEACGNQVIFSTHCHNDLGLATANSLAGIHAGARQVECTINGIGERAGNAALEEIVMALRVRNSIFNCDTAINAPLLMQASKLVSTFSGFSVQPNKAIVGKNAFSHEAGIHQDGVLKRRDTYEIMRAEDVGQSAQSIKLGRHSGRHGVFNRLAELGFSIQEDKKQDLYEKFLALADQKKEIYDEDLEVLVNAQMLQDHSKIGFELEYLSVKFDSNTIPEAHVRIKSKQSGAVVSTHGTGDGPIDATYRAIDHALEHAYKLTGYEIKALSEGQDAIGDVVVQVSFRNRKFKGKAQHQNTIMASALAYINAINQVEAYRETQDFAGQAIRASFGR